jgi:hypothetical protein
VPGLDSVAGRGRHLQQVVKGLDLLAGFLEELARLLVVVRELQTQLGNDVFGELGVIGPPFSRLWASVSSRRRASISQAGQEVPVSER